MYSYENDENGIWNIIYGSVKPDKLRQQRRRKDQSRLKGICPTKFDNPNDLKEIISIKKRVSVNTDSVIAKLEKALLIGKENNDKLNYLISNKDTNEGFDYLRTPEFDSFSREWFSLAMKIVIIKQEWKILLKMERDRSYKFRYLYG